MPAAVEPGSRFGPYEIGKRIGEGGMGIVHRATLGRDVVALKFLRPELRDDQTYARRFAREVRTAQAIDHPHLVAIVGGGQLDGELFVASRYLEGRSLHDRIVRKELPVADVVAIIRQVAAALDHLHAEGFIHRDVKPANIMFDKAGRAYLGDFGLATSEAFTVLTKPGEVMGTVAYLAPELLRGQPAGPSSDIYALACTAFEALTGFPPFPHTSILDCARAHLEAPPPDPRVARPELPEATAFVFAKGMAKNPAERSSTAVGLATSIAMAAGI